MEYWLSALFMMLEDISLIFFFDAFFERKRRGAAFWGILLLITLVGYAITNLLRVRISFLKLFLMLSLLLLINLFLYHGTFVMRLLVVVSFYACGYALSFLIDNLVLLALHLSYEKFVYNRALYVAVSLGIFFLQIFLAALLKRIRRPRNLKKHPWAGVTLIFPLASLSLLVPLYSVSYNYEQAYEQAAPLLLGFAATLVAVDIGIVILIDWLEQNDLMRQQALATSERLAAQEQSVEALSAAYAAQRKMTHDFRHHLTALSGLLSQEAAPAAAQYVEELQREQTERILAVNTHHAAIDAVLNQKALYAQKRGIDMQFEVNDLSALKIREIDCTVVLANLLDNAVEACAKLEQPERWIEVKALLEHTGGTEDETLFISVVNASPPVKIVNDRIDTTKENPSLHGFGLPNVKEILSQNGAEYIMTYQDNTFQFSLEWPNAAH